MIKTALLSLTIFFTPFPVWSKFLNHEITGCDPRHIERVFHAASNIRTAPTNYKMPEGSYFFFKDIKCINCNIEMNPTKPFHAPSKNISLHLNVRQAAWIACNRLPPRNVIKPPPHNPSPNVRVVVEIHKVLEKGKLENDFNVLGRGLPGVFNRQLNGGRLRPALKAQVNLLYCEVSPYLRFANSSSLFGHVLGGFKCAPNKKHTQERYDSKPDSSNEHAERPRRHVLLSLQIIFGLLYAAISAYIVGQTSKPVDQAAFAHDGPAGSWAMIGGIGLILGSGCAFIGMVLLVG